ncbi:MAG: glycoside hydrolase family 5 protein, partial [Planctomycetia bacterium]
MRRRTALIVGSSAVLSSAAGAPEPPSVPIRGVSLAGAEFGTGKPEFSNRHPGLFERDYTYNSDATVRRLVALGLPLVRIPFRWERMQPTLGGPLKTAELARLRAAVEWVHAAGGRSLVDLHNYARYRLETPTGVVEAVIDHPDPASKTVYVTKDHFTDFWIRLSRALVDLRGAYGLGLMNEPHDMGSADWRAISSATVRALRDDGCRRWLVVGGDGWSNAHRWPDLHGPDAWIDDPLKKTVYESHSYFDKDASGKYVKSYADELKDDPALPDRGAARVKPFLEWCARNGVPGVVGEYGAPADPGWLEVARRFLAACDAAATPTCWWAAGEWWADYPLS